MSIPRHRSCRSGFTVVDLAVCLTAGVVGTACLLSVGGVGIEPGASDDGNKKDGIVFKMLQRPDNRGQAKDAAQIRGIVQAMIIFANNNDDKYPLPSHFDAQNATVTLKSGEDARSKDTTANIFSILIWNGAISPELCVSPGEKNKRIRVNTSFEYDEPKAAAKSKDAMWDPAFAADFTEKKTGNFSYGHLQPSDNRLSMWQNTFNANEALIGDRGPEIADVERDAAGKVTHVKTAIENSKTLRIFGSPRRWEGNMGFNDGHVEFISGLEPPAAYAMGNQITYKLDEKGEKTRSDVLFYDEPDTFNGTNLFLGIFAKAGKKPEEFKAIWD